MVLTVVAAAFLACGNDDLQHYGEGATSEHAWEPFGEQVMKPTALVQRTSGPKVASWRVF